MRLILIIVRISAGRANCPALLCKSDICPNGLRAGVYVQIRQFLVVCKSDPKNFYSVRIRQWIFLKTPAITNCVRILWNLLEYVQIRHVLRCANPMKFLWVRREGVWLYEFGWEKLEWINLERKLEGAAVLVLQHRFAAFLGKSWGNLGKFEISRDKVKFY